jgi:hypothetical protein
LEKLKINANGAAPGVYGPFYTFCDVIVGENGSVILRLSENGVADGHVYELDANNNKMKMTKQG